MSFREITDVIERSDAAEARFGIRIAGLFASLEDDPANDGKYYVEINGEVEGISASGLEYSVEIQFISQNERGQNIGVNGFIILCDRFSGYEAFSQLMHCKGIPTRLRIIPKMI